MRYDIISLGHALEGGGAEESMRNLQYNVSSLFRFLRVGVFPSNVIAPEKSLLGDRIELLTSNRRNALSLFRAGVALRKLLLRHSPRIVLINCEIAEILFSLFAPKSRAILVHHISEKWAFSNHRIIFRVVRLILWFRSVKHVYVSNSLLSESKDSNGIVLQNIYDYSRCAFFSGESSAPRLLFIGRLHEQKRPEQVLRIGQALDCTVVFFGEGPLKENLVTQACNLNIDVEFKGFDNNLWMNTWDSDILILPSKYEGKPMVISEALYRGLRVVTYSHSYLTSEYEGFPVHFADSLEGLISMTNNILTVPQVNQSEVIFLRNRLSEENSKNCIAWKEFLKELMSENESQFT